LQKAEVPYIMGEFCILDVEEEKDYSIWNSVIKQYFKNEPMLKADYYKLFSDSDNRGMAAFYRDNQDIIIYPFMKRGIPDFQQYFDIISAYGYGGPYASSGIQPYHWKDFWFMFDAWCHEHMIVSEVIKFGLFGNDACHYPGKIRGVMNNVVRTLEISIPDLYRDYEHKVRKNVKRAEKYQLSFALAHTKDRIDDFLKIYYGTMDRRNAEKKYYFDKKFFQVIDLKMKDNNRVFFVSYEGKPVSTELVLISEENIYSYLGGTNPDYFEMRPNDFLKAKIIEWGHENGYKNYILGGGYGKEDGIYRYKKSFAPDGIKAFKIGSRVLNEEKYREICIQKGVEVKDDFIPAYRRN
jgi:hypothetical protein